MKKHISLIIPAYNESLYLVDTLKEVNKYRAEFWEVIVVDNASKDGTGEIAEEFVGVKVVRESKKGVTQARQTGAKASTGELLAFLDADARITDTWVATIDRIFSQNSDVVCLSGPCYFREVSFVTRFFVWLYWAVLARAFYIMTGYMAVGGNMVMRREAFEKVGGFDEAISFFGDDTDMAKRIRTLGAVLFLQDFYTLASPRRIEKEGLFRAGFMYAINFFSVVFRGVPATHHYTDVR